MKIFGREPALVMAAIGAAIVLVSALWIPLTPEQQGVLNGVVAALFGFITAALVAKEKFVPALIGLLKAIIAIAIAFGLHLAAGDQAVIYAFVATVAAMFTRTQVVASVSADQAP